MSAGEFLLGELAELRFLAVCIAPPDWPLGDLEQWPRFYARDEHGAWTLVDFGRARRARQLACLLAHHHDGVHARIADQHFAQQPDDPAQPPAALTGAAKTARQTLQNKLAATGIPGLAELLKVPASGHRGAPPWRLEAAATDVELARRAVAERQWAAASVLTYATAGRLIGFAATARTRPSSFGLRERTEQRAIRAGLLPPGLVEHAHEASISIATHYVSADTGPPRIDDLFGALLADVGPAVQPSEADDTKPQVDEEVVDAEIVELEPAVRPPAGQPSSRELILAAALPAPVSSPTIEQATPTPIRLPAPGSGGELTIYVDPLRRAPHRRPWLLLGLGGLAAALVLAITLVLALRPATTRTRSSTVASLSTAQNARIEQETYSHAVPTFANPHELVRTTSPAEVPPGRIVLVSCREYVPSAASAKPYWWYELRTAPWSSRFAAANTFLNGDPAADFVQPGAHRPHQVHNFDTAVPVCQSNTPGGSLETPGSGNVATFANPSAGTRPGPSITGGRPVLVSCKVASTAAVAEPGGYAYRLSGTPWNDRFYAPARLFHNAIPANSTQSQLVDIEVPNCPPGNGR